MAAQLKYSLLIYSDGADKGASSALALAKAIVHSEHTLYRLFFYRSGVMLAKKTSSASRAPDLSIASSWQHFVSEHNVDAVVCVSAAVRRALVSEEESHSTTLEFANIASSFQVSGLGQLADALANSDRVVSFG